MDYNKNLFVTFLNQEKAFDRVDRKLLWLTLTQYEVSEHLIRVCKCLYHYCRSVVKSKNIKTLHSNMQSKTGMCIITTIVYHLQYIDSISKETKPKNGNNINKQTTTTIIISKNYSLLIVRN